MLSDKEIMQRTLARARVAMSEGNYAIAAALRIDDVVRYYNNTNVDYGDWAHHAENTGITALGRRILEARKEGIDVTLYSTLEPCLMCLGTAVLNRVSRIVYSCPDPYGGATGLNPMFVSEFYARNWPQIQGGLLREQGYDLFMEFMNKTPHRWEKTIKSFEEMKRSWN